MFAGLPRPNAETRLTHSDSFGSMSFVGGETEAQDHWDRKWEAHRMTSFELSRNERGQRGHTKLAKPAVDPWAGAIALGGILPAGHATLAPRKKVTRSANEMPSVHSGE